MYPAAVTRQGLSGENKVESGNWCALPQVKLRRTVSTCSEWREGEAARSSSGGILLRLRVRRSRWRRTEQSSANSRSSWGGIMEESYEEKGRRGKKG